MQSGRAVASPPSPLAPSQAVEILTGRAQACNGVQNGCGHFKKSCLSSACPIMRNLGNTAASVALAASARVELCPPGRPASQSSIQRVQRFAPRWGGPRESGGAGPGSCKSPLQEPETPMADEEGSRDSQMPQPGPGWRCMALKRAALKAKMWPRRKRREAAKSAASLFWTAWPRAYNQAYICSPEADLLTQATIITSIIACCSACWRVTKVRSASLSGSKSQGSRGPSAGRSMRSTP